MSDYITNTKNRILKTFDDYPVVLVQICSSDAALNGQILAISSNTGGYPSIEILEKIGFSASDTFGVTTKCIELMDLLQKTQHFEYRTETKCSYKKCLQCGLVFSEMYENCPSCKSNKFENFSENVKPMQKENTQIQNFKSIQKLSPYSKKALLFLVLFLIVCMIVSIISNS